MSTDHEAACRRVQARLELYLDGGLDPVEEARDRGHLEACADCQGERDRWVRLLGAVREVAITDDVPFATHGLDEKLEALLARARPSRLRLVLQHVSIPLATVAASLAAMLLVDAAGLGPERLPELPSGDHLLGRVEFGLPDWGVVIDSVTTRGGG